MKNVFKALTVVLTLFSLTGCGLKGPLYFPTVVLTLFSLTGCGLKGPLYFPPADKNTPPPTNPVETKTQSTGPDKHDRATGDGPSQVNY